MNIKTLLKKSLSVILAGAMSVVVFTACNDKEDKKEENSLSVKEMLIDVLDTTANSNLFSGVFSGEANTASKTSATVEFGKGITDALGTEVKPLSLTSETKLKGSNAGTDISITYDGNNLVSLNGVYDNESKTVFVKVPELSDAYISVSLDDLNGIRDDILSSGMAISGIKNPAVFNLNKLAELNITDYEKILNDYIKVIKDSLPETSKEEDFNGAISEVEYAYKLKTYTLTSDNIKNIVDNVFEKLKNDEKIKQLAVGILGSVFELTEENYSSKVDEAKNSIIEDLGSNTDSREISLIYDGENIVGIKDDVTLMCVDRKEAYAVSIEGKGVNYSLNVTADDGKLDFDCDLNIVSTDDETENLTMSAKIDNIEIVDKKNGLLSNDVEFQAMSNGKTIKLDETNKAEDSKMNSNLKISVDDIEYATITSTNEITNASDITIPSGTIYTLDQIEDYQSSIKLDEFMTNIQSVLGEDLTEALSAYSEGLLAGNMGEYSDESDVSADEDAIMLEDYYNDDGSFDYDKLKEDLGEEDYKAFMSQIDIDDLEVDADDIKL